MRRAFRSSRGAPRFGTAKQEGNDDDDDHTIIAIAISGKGRCVCVSMHARVYAQISTTA